MSEIVVETPRIPWHVVMVVAGGLAMAGTTAHIGPPVDQPIQSMSTTIGHEMPPSTIYELLDQDATVHHAPQTRAPLYQTALAALQAGQLEIPPRRPQLRPEAEWRQDLADARFFDEPDIPRGRRLAL